ncbi:zinc finger protein 574-like [Schistocerca piceifrons]|uniref:zinc finger protein 574-like n=1 Tax=Schistocerca piceifrons TaxID=274613 RepID=UPI001F5F1A15|nr:zinc finger protein 574-like [Schistocerca piceifrons]
MKWELKDRHSKSPRAYQIVSERPQIATQRPSDGVVSPIANNYSTADVACIDQMHAGGKGGGHGPPPPSWPKLKSQNQQKRPTTLKLDVGAAQRAPPERLPSPRPQTATLDRPRILDIALLGKIDMTLTRKALLSISSLCAGAPADAAKRNGASPGDGRGGKSRRFQPAAGRSAHTDEDDGTSSGTAPPTPRRQPAKKQQLKVPAARRRPAPAGEAEEARAGAGAVPQPCTTCGRHEQPERLHSHPPARHQQAQQPQPQAQAPPQPPKSSVRKPMPINFRSSASTAQQQQQQQQSSAAAPAPDKSPGPQPSASTATVAVAPAPASSASAPVAAPAAATAAANAPAAPRAPGRPRTVVCYLCGREFGTKSYPLHEPHCLQKWHRENSLLPPQLQREPPPRPDQPPTTSQWNHLAWEAVQGSLVPCENCGRTFNPDRLEVHQRSCKGTQPKRAPVHQQHPPQQQQQQQQQQQTRGAANRCFSRTVCVVTAARHHSTGTTNGAVGRRRAPRSKLRDARVEVQATAGSRQQGPLPSGSRSCPRVLCLLVTRNAFQCRIGHLRCLEEAKGMGEPFSAAAAAAMARVGHACRWCGRLFGSASLRIHEAQCAQRQDRAAAPATVAASGAASPAPTSPASASGAASPEHRPRGPRMLLCYLCGRGFTQASLHIHEAQCLKRWHQENDRLPPAQRRPTPERPAIVLTESGGLDLEATVEAAWQSHLQQLVPCHGCGRTFYPDRLEVHRRACKGQGRR